MKSLGMFFQADVPTHRIIVVDTSFSMAHQPAEFSRLDRAKEAARRIVSATHQGDALNLVRIGTLPPRVIVQKPAFQKGQVLEEIEDLEQSHESSDLIATLQDAAQLLNEAPEIEQKEIILISDFQRVSWRRGTPSGGRRFARCSSKWGTRPAFRFWMSANRRLPIWPLRNSRRRSRLSPWTGPWDWKPA